MRLIEVVLPAPFGPRRATSSPAPIVRSTPFSASTAPNRLRAPASSTTGVTAPRLSPILLQGKHLSQQPTFSVGSLWPRAGNGEHTETNEEHPVRPRRRDLSKIRLSTEEQKPAARG